MNACVHFADAEVSGLLTSFSDDGQFLIRDGDKQWRFVWSDRFGALAVGRRGQTVEQPGWRSRFYAVTTMWARQGKRTAPAGRETLAVWEQPPPGLDRVRRLGRRSWLLVESIEPPGFDPDYSEVIREVVE